MKYPVVISRVWFACVLAVIAPISALAQPDWNSNGSGMIQGELIYPSNVILAQRVCAMHLETEQETCIETKQDQAQYSLPVQAGIYKVFAIACKQRYGAKQTCVDGYRDDRAYYNAFVQCGLTYQCQQQITKNEPIVVTVKPGMKVNGVNPHDWYTP